MGEDCQKNVAYARDLIDIVDARRKPDPRDPLDGNAPLGVIR